MSRFRKPRGNGRAKYAQLAVATTPTDGAAPESALGTAVELIHDEPRPAGRRKPYRRLNAEERSFMFSAIARARLAYPGVRAISPIVEQAWLATWGWSPGRDAILDYMCRPWGAAERQAALQAEGSRLLDAPSLTPLGRIALCDAIIGAAMEPLPVGRVSARVLQEGQWTDDSITFHRRDLKAAIEALRLREEIIRAVTEAGGQRAAEPALKAGPAVARHARKEADEGDIIHVDPVAEAELEAERGKPFRIPNLQGLLTPVEQHREMIRRWDEVGIAPPGMPPRPTRRVHPDGRVEILDGEDANPVVRPTAHVGDRPDYGHAVLAGEDRA